MKSGLRNSVKQARSRLGLSQQELAQLAGVTRQTIGGVEAGLFAPSAVVALRLSRALGCSVEDLFWMEDDAPPIHAIPAAGLRPGEGARVALAQVGGRWVAHPLHGDRAFRTELIPADGEADWAEGETHAWVRPEDDPRSLSQTVALAGCTPALSLWARAAERWHPGLRVHWFFANSMAALESLARGEVHGAGVHLYDPKTRQYNLPFAQQALPGQALVLVNLGVWEEGLLVRPGNPLGLRGVADLAQRGVRFVNRDRGAGARQLLDQHLQSESIPSHAVAGYDWEAPGHTDVAQAVAAGRVDAGVSAAAVAAAFGLGFVPLRQVRFDMVLRREYLAEEPVRQLLDTLGHRRVRSQLEALGGYDTALTGEIVGEVAINPDSG